MYPVYIIFSIFDTFMYTHAYLTLYRNKTGFCSNTVDIFVKSVCHYIKYVCTKKKKKGKPLLHAFPFQLNFTMPLMLAYQ